MANFALTDYTTDVKPLKDVLADLETYLETVDVLKTIRGVNVIPVGSDNAQGWVLHDA